LKFTILKHFTSLAFYIVLDELKKIHIEFQIHSKDIDGKEKVEKSIHFKTDEVRKDLLIFWNSLMVLHLMKPNTLINDLFF